MNTGPKKQNIRDLERLSEFLDSKYKLPGGIGIGWDAILGLVPGVGDLITSSMSFYILFRAAMIGTPPFVLARMCINILIDNVIGFIPLFGNVFDIFWRSNNKNVALLQNHLLDPTTTSRKAKVSVILSLILISIFALCLFGLIIWGMYLFTVLVIEAIQTMNGLTIEDY